MPFNLTPLRISLLWLAWPSLLISSAAAQPLDTTGQLDMPPPRSPAESLASIQVPSDLEVELVVAEPTVKDPISISWGPDGRMWVVEMADYPLGMDGAGKPGGRIRVLESTRGDGVYDRATLFADGLSFPTSVIVWRKGILVTVAPDLLYLEDTDGDGRADVKRKLFTGLGEGNQQHMANGLKWGLDGWLYLAHGGTPGQIVSTRTGAVVEMNRDVRVKPDEGLAEPVFGRSQYGRSRNDWGDWFGCNNIHPAWHYGLEDAYLNRNPHLVPPAANIEVMEIPGAAPVYPISRTLERFNAVGKGFNHFTSACSVMIYRGNGLGDEYNGDLFVCEPVHNLVHREVMTPQGVTYVGRRAPTEKTSEFLASTDNWSRFTDVSAAPDGAFYVVDMYRYVIEHPQYIPQSWEDLIGDAMRAGEEQGRIYRVRPRDTLLRVMPRLDQADVNELVEALGSPNGTVRDLAQQQLLWRNATSAAPALRSLLTQAEPASRAQILWTLALLHELQPAQVLTGLHDPHPGVRRQAIRLSERFSETAPTLLADLIKLVDDPDDAVRQQVAYSLGAWNRAEAGTALAQMMRREEEPLIVTALMSSAVPHVNALVADLEPGAEADGTLIETVVGTGNVAAVRRILAPMQVPSEQAYSIPQLRTLAKLVDSLSRNNRSPSQLLAQHDREWTAVAESVSQLVEPTRGFANDSRVPMALRLASVDLLGRDSSRASEDVAMLLNMLAPRSPVALQQAAVASLARMSEVSIANLLLDRWESFTPRIRSAALNLLVSRPEWAVKLIDRIEATPVLLGQIDRAYRVALSRQVRVTRPELAKALLNSGVDEDRQRVIGTYASALKNLTGNAERGAEVFGTACSACHKFDRFEGSAIGPDLGSLKDRSAEYLLTHILNPNVMVANQYLLFTAVTADERTLVGSMASETENSITLRGLDGVETVVLRSQLKSLTSSGLSMMPVGLESTISEQAMADLIAYISGVAP